MSDIPEQPVAARGQSLSHVRELLQGRGLRPKEKLGQNFLVDLNLLEVLLQAAELTGDDLVVEIGAGTGSLTARLAQKAGAVFSVEIDSAFMALAQKAVGHDEPVRLVHADILHGKNHFNPDVLRLLDEHRRKWPCARLKLVANLPYAVATPVIANFLLSDLTFERMVVTVQLEIAEKLIAVPATKDYGALSVLVQSLAEVEVLRRLPPSVFWPRPKVASAFVCIRPDPARRAEVGDVHAFRIFLRDLYSHRRKNLRGALGAIPGQCLDKPAIDRKLADLGIDGSLRAETLDIEQHLRLCRTFASE